MAPECSLGITYQLWLWAYFVYGVVPAGTEVLHAPEPLQPGTQYGVYVAIVVGTDTLSSIGNFTP